MADQYFKYVDGVLKSYTAAEYETAFGIKPTQPKKGEKLFGGRYENKTFYTSSTDSAYNQYTDEGLPAALKGYNSLSSSYNIEYENL